MILIRGGNNFGGFDRCSVYCARALRLLPMLQAVVRAAPGEKHGTEKEDISFESEFDISRGVDSGCG